MVNVYFFSDSAAPSGFSEIDAGYRERYVKLGATPLSTGGASTHVHTGSATNSANSNTNSLTAHILGSIANGSTHTHSTTTVSTVGNGSNFDAYRTLRCHYRSTTNWDGQVPAGLIAFSESVPASGWDRFWNGQSEFIMISGTYNSTGGGTHSHSVSGSIPNSAVGAQNGSTYNAPSTAQSTHGHASFSTTITASVYDYYYWSCGLVKSNATVYIKKDMYVLFDGDPGAGWADTGVSSRYLKCSANNAVATGGSYLTTSHPHSGSVNSSSSNSCINSTGGNLYGTALCSHVHQVNISLNSVTAEPSWVGLSLYKAAKNFGSSIKTRSIFVTTC
jgi:hypothetical protein